MMKLSAIICLLVPLYIEFIAATPCINMAVEVEVQNGIRLTGDGSFKPDNYVLRLGDQAQKTKVIDSSSNPNWMETLRFDPSSSDILIIEVCDEDSGFRGDDDLIGTCTENLSQSATSKIFVCAVPEDGLVNLQYKCK